MFVSKGNLSNVKYVITDDSLPEQPPAWKTPMFKLTVSTFALMAATVVCLYFAGIVDGTSAVEAIAENEIEFVEFDAATDALCLSYSIVVDACTDVTVDEIAENGCMSYVESNGGICVCYDESETLCVVNDDCDLVDTSVISTMQLDGATDALCESFSIVVDACTDVSVEEIAENGCMSYVESTGGICVCYDDSETLCVVNDDCGLVDTSVLSLFQLDDATDALCESYSIVVDACMDVSVEEIAENGCMSYVESTGGICVCYDDTKTLCVVNDDCDMADTTVIQKLQLDDATDALCESFSMVVEACTDVSVEEIAENGCMSYVESSGGICVCYDDSETLCVVNDDCDPVDTSVLSNLKLDAATDALCQSYSIVVDKCTDVSVEEIAENGCMSYVENTGGICVCYDDSETLCVVNDDCDLLDTTVISTLQLDDATDALCESFSIVVEACTDVSVDEIAENGCMSYVESTGGICVCYDDSETLCVVNDDCDLVDTSVISTLQLDDATDALCESYSIVVEACTGVSVEEIAENGCMSYVESTGGICVCYDDSETLCVVNDDCDLVDTSVLTTLQLDDATDALCESYSMVVNACTDVSVENIAKNGCMSYVERTGGVCVCYDDSETLCVVNDDCGMVDTSDLTTSQLDGATDALCQSYSIVVDACSDVSVEEIAENGCMSYVESDGGICVCYDESETLCVVNDDCDLVDTSVISTLQLDGATDALCQSYSIVVEACTDVSVQEIAENGCMSYVESTGGICVCFDDSETLCVINDDCDLVDISVLPTSDGATNALCKSYSRVVDKCTDVSVEEIAENGCMSYVESTGGICVCYDDSETLCVVNEDCDLVDTSVLSTSELDAATDALCQSYSIVVDACTDVSVEAIAKNGCMSYVESTGGICVCFDDSETLCVVNDDCDLVDTSVLSTFQLDDATDALCESFSLVVDDCTEVTVAEIAENGCMSYVESTGGICVCYDDSETLCVVNDDCDLVDTSIISTLQLDGATDALCMSYSIVVDDCTDVSVEDIAENGCMSYVETTGGICVCYDDSKTLCVVNDDCDLVDVAGLSTIKLDDATDALCESYSIVVSACTDVSVEDIAENGCMSYVEATGGICVCYDDSKQLCVVNDDCDLVDTSALLTV